MSLVARASRRFFQRQPWQALLAVLGIALGVAVVVGVDLTEASARRSFGIATATVLGATTHQILGGPSGIDERSYARLRRAGVGSELAPIVEGSVSVPGRGVASIALVGIDPLVDGAIRAPWASAAPDSASSRILREPDAVLLTRAAAERLHARAGQRLTVAAAGRNTQLTVVGVLDAQPGAPALAATELAIADIATAQELLGSRGRLSRIDVVANSEQELAALREHLDPGVEILASPARSRSTLALSRAFYTNLRALGLLALLVGVFLVYNAQSFMVMQRHATFATLRALGASRTLLVAAVLREALAMGTAGTLFGLALGAGLAHGLLALVTRTLNDLYFAAAPDLRFDAFSAAKALVLGVGVSLLAALVPARMALDRPPHGGYARSTLERTARRRIARAGRWGLGLAAAGALLLFVPGGVALGFGGLFCVLLGYALATPAACAWVIARIERPRHWLLRVSLSNLEMALGRSAVATAALSLAIAASLGIGLMITSFRSAVGDWLEQLLRADYYVMADAGTARNTRIALGLVDAIEQLPGIHAVTHVRRIRLAQEGGDAALAAYRWNPQARAGFRLLTPEAARFWERLEEEDRALVSEPYARRHGLAPGERLSLRTDRGPREFTVAGVYQDYGSEHGVITLARRTYDRHWQDPFVSGIGLYVDAGFDVRRFRRWLADAHPDPPLQVRAHAEIRALSLAVFDRTFTVTEVLRLIAALIATLGMLSTLLAIELERGRDLAVLMALGCTPREIRRIALTETGALGVLAGLFALPAGIGLAALLVHVINVRSFGWSMDLLIAPTHLLACVLAACGAALLAGIYPAARLSRQSPVAALRAE